MPKYNMLKSEKEIERLQNQIYKLLPISEGKDINGKVVYDEFDSKVHFKKNLVILNNKILGASKIWFENQYWRDLIYQIEGLLAYDYSHDQIKQTIFYCRNDLCEKMKEEVRSG